MVHSGSVVEGWFWRGRRRLKLGVKVQGRDWGEKREVYREGGGGGGGGRNRGSGGSGGRKFRKGHRRPV